MFPLQNARSFPLPEQLDFPLDVYQECYEQWRARQISQGALTANKLTFEEHRKALLADWLRDLVASGYGTLFTTPGEVEQIGSGYEWLLPLFHLTIGRTSSCFI